MFFNHTIPIVLEQEGRTERSYDIFSRLLRDRIIMVGSIDGDAKADLIVAQILFLTSDNPEKNIHMYINSPGGIITAGLAIYDTMQYVKSNIVTIVNGQASSMGAVLAAAGTKGKRYALPNARIMIHQPSGGAQGQHSDIERSFKEMARLRTKLEEILSHHTERPVDQIHQDCERDYFMSAAEAVDYGIIDKVLRPGDCIE